MPKEQVYVLRYIFSAVTLGIVHTESSSSLVHLHLLPNPRARPSSLATCGLVHKRRVQLDLTLPVAAKKWATKHGVRDAVLVRAEPRKGCFARGIFRLLLSAGAAGAVLEKSEAVGPKVYGDGGEGRRRGRRHGHRELEAEDHHQARQHRERNGKMPRPRKRRIQIS